jgi:hypothetical protein
MWATFKQDQKSHLPGFLEPHKGRHWERVHKLQVVKLDRANFPLPSLIEWNQDRIFFSRDKKLQCLDTCLVLAIDRHLEIRVSIESLKLKKN